MRIEERILNNIFVQAVCIQEIARTIEDGVDNFQKIIDKVKLLKAMTDNFEKLEREVNYLQDHIINLKVLIEE
jgi:hypothetical protein